MVDTQTGIINVIEHLRLAVVQPAQGQRAGAARQKETGVQFVRGRKIRLAVGKNNFEFAGVDDRAGRERPRGEVRVAVGEIKVGQRNDVRGRVVKFQPCGVLAGAVRDAVQIVGLKFIKPQRRKRREIGEN